MDEHGFLPPGVHDCTLEEIEQRFARFGRTAQRRELFPKLTSFVQEARSTEFVTAVIVDGSHVTAEPEPGDIDLILGVPESHDFDAKLQAFEYNVVSKARVRQLYHFDLLGAAPESSDAFRGLVEFFQGVRRPAGARKGILRVRL